VAADPVGPCRRCPFLPRSAWYDQCPFSLLAVDGTSRSALALAAATAEGADEVTVPLQRDGPLVRVAANDQAISDMDAGQYASEEGPCANTSLEGRWSHLQSVDEEHRWTAFCPKSTPAWPKRHPCQPLIASGRPVGVSNVYSRTAGGFGAEE
jgi:hypothetical protein